jgi:molybdate transport repressor ModE-like protein
MEIDPRRLRVLLAIAHTGGVLAAADELGISPSAISQQLHKLEEETGHTLVVRTTRGSTLTRAGLAMAEAAEEIERVLNTARVRITNEAELSGVVGLGGFTSFLRTVVIPRLPEWRIRYPQLLIRVVEDDPPALMQMLRQRELDAVVVELDSTTSEQRPLTATVSEEPLLDEPWKLVVPSGSLLDTENIDLARLPIPWLGVDSASASASVVGRFRRGTGGAGETIHRYQETLTALALVAAGEGVAVVPALALSDAIPNGVTVLDVPGLGTRRIVLRRIERQKSAPMPVDTVVRLLRESVAELESPRGRGTGSA